MSTLRGVILSSRARDCFDYKAEQASCSQMDPCRGTARCPTPRPSCPHQHTLCPCRHLGPAVLSTHPFVHPQLSHRTHKEVWLCVCRDARSEPSMLFKPSEDTTTGVLPDELSSPGCFSLPPFFSFPMGEDVLPNEAVWAFHSPNCGCDLANNYVHVSCGWCGLLSLFGQSHKDTNRSMSPEKHQEMLFTTCDGHIDSK